VKICAGLCSEEKIDGVVRFGGVWAIPESTLKPTRSVNMKPGRKPIEKHTKSQMGT